MTLKHFYLCTVCLASSFISSGYVSAADPKLLLEITNHTFSPVVRSISVDLPTGRTPRSLYLRIHSLRFGGQVSVRLNASQRWLNITNQTVTLAPNEASQGGIGGINSTIQVTIPLESLGVTQVNSGINTVHMRLNGTNGITTAVRLIDIDFLDAQSNPLLPEDQKREVHPSTWRPSPGFDNDEASNAGRGLWRNANIIEDPSKPRTPYLNAKCASCHFEDGSDLKYFNFSNESIVTRSRFHGLGDTQARQIASYILRLNKPTRGQPWNPPFQPGAGLDPVNNADRANKVEGWMAGAGLQSVISSDTEIFDKVFPNGAGRASIAGVIDHRKNFSVRQIPIQFQFPDWNAWLPHHAPEDIWIQGAGYPNNRPFNRPALLLEELRNALRDPDTGASRVDALTSSGQLISTFDAFNKGMEDWYGQFRLVGGPGSAESDISALKRPRFTREEAIKGLAHWTVIKIMENVRNNDIEGKHVNIAVMRASGHPRFEPDPLLMPGSVKLSSVFSLAPHIISDNWINFKGQPEWLGKMESDQWYHLSLCLNSGSRMQLNDNVPLDWDYQLIHIADASERVGIPFGFQNLVTNIKMYQSRDNDAGLTIKGFSPRFLTPWRLYSDQTRNRSLMKGALDAVRPDLWRKTFEEFLYEQLDVLESFDLDNPNLVPRRIKDSAGNFTPRHHLEPMGYEPVAWSGMTRDNYFQHPDEIYADLIYRLLPLLPKEGVDVMLLRDYRSWCRKAWTSAPWSIDANFRYSEGNPLYQENFEAATSDFSGLQTTLIKNPAYTHHSLANVNGTPSPFPRNGGGTRIAYRGLTSDSFRTSLWNAGVSQIDIRPYKRLKLKARVAFDAGTDNTTNSGVVKFKMQVKFGGSSDSVDGDTELTLPTALSRNKFLSYESELLIPPNVTHINQLVLHWHRDGGSGNGWAFIDNVHFVGVDDLTDTTPPSPPSNTTLPVSVYQDGTPAVPSTFLRPRWSHPNPEAQGVVGYNVKRRSSPNEQFTTINLGLVEYPNNFYSDYTITHGSTYEYQITAVDAAGNESAPLDLPSTRVNDVVLPNRPPVLFAERRETSVYLSWFGVNDLDIRGYEVFRRVSGSTGPFSLLTQTPIAQIYYTDTSVVTGQSYEYAVRTIDFIGNESEQRTQITIGAQVGSEAYHPSR